MPRIVAEFPSVAQEEMEICCRQGLSAQQTRVRLIRCGVTLPERTLSRRMAAIRAAQQRMRESREFIAAFKTLRPDLPALVALTRESAPAWRAEQVRVMRNSFEEFIKESTPAQFTGLLIQGYALVISEAVEHSSEKHGDA
jgi:hypothetical protein